MRPLLDRMSASTFVPHCRRTMVTIIDGEIVQDDDPRAVARRQSRAARGSGTSRGGPGEGSGAGGSASRRGGFGPVIPAGDAPAEDPDGLLAPLARASGLAGRFVTIPAVAALGTRELKIPLIEVIAAGLAVALGGRTGAGLALLFFILTKRV